MRTRGFPVALITASAALLLGSCDTPEVRRLNDPNAYLQRANATYTDVDAMHRLFHALELRHGDVDAPLRAAMRANRRIRIGKPPGWVPNPPLPPPKPQHPAVYVAVLIDPAGKVLDVASEPASSTMAGGQLAFVERTVRGWQFEPTTIDDQAVASFYGFGVETDGATFVRYVPREH